MRQTILNTIADLSSNFLYYDRKGDEELSSTDLKQAIESGEITIDEIVNEFRHNLETGLKSI